MTTKSKLLKAIREKCMDCSNYQPKEITLCTIPDCSLYPYREGKDPTKRVMTEEQKAALVARLGGAKREPEPNETTVY